MAKPGKFRGPGGVWSGMNCYGSPINTQEAKMEMEKTQSDQPVKELVGEFQEKKSKKRGRGRPKGSKDSAKRRVRDPSLTQLAKIAPDSPTKALAVFSSNFIENGQLDRLMKKLVEVAFNDDHKLQGMAWQELMKRGVPMSLFEKTGGGGNGPVINISIGSADEIDIE